MLEKVSAATISALTTSFGFSSRSIGAPPTAEQMVERIRSGLSAEAKHLAQQIGTPVRGAPPTAFEISHHKVVKMLQDFERIVTNVPKGFKLTPVLYSKIERQQNEDVMKEYSTTVRRPFLKYLAENHAAELTALGICQHGIDRMRKGLDPGDASGMLYDTNIDHIVERSGGGKMSLKKSVDPLMPPGSPPTYLVNHFSNFVLLPEQVHHFKNDLNDIQDASLIRVGDSDWVLMLIPETGPGQSGFVCAPQDPGHILQGVRMRAPDLAKKISHAAFMADQVFAVLDEFRTNATVAGFLKKAEDVAAQQNKTVVGVLRAEKKEAPVGKPSLSQAFNDVVSKMPPQQEALNDFVKPTVEDAGQQLKIAFDEAVKPGQSVNNYGSFLNFYRGHKMDRLRQEIMKLPLDEAVKVWETMQEIERAVRSRPTPPPQPKKDKKPYYKDRRR